MAKYGIHKDICTPLFTAALFTVANTWRQPKCASIDDGIKMWYMYTMEYSSAMRKDGTLPLVTTWVDLEIIVLSEISQSEKAKNHMISLIHGM